jgi:hypothetical protein
MDRGRSFTGMEEVHTVVGLPGDGRLAFHCPEINSGAFISTNRKQNYTSFRRNHSFSSHENLRSIHKGIAFKAITA